jgi:hypothetical protein
MLNLADVGRKATFLVSTNRSSLLFYYHFTSPSDDPQELVNDIRVPVLRASTCCSDKAVISYIGARWSDRQPTHIPRR